MVHVEIDKEKCIGCGACAAQCDNFEIKDGKAHVKNADPDESGCNEEAKSVCPVGAIKVE